MPPKVTKKAPASTGTGLFLACAEGSCDEEHRDVWLEVKKGPKAEFQRCPLCRGCLFYGPASKWRSVAKTLPQVLAKTIWRVIVKANGEVLRA